MRIICGKRSILQWLEITALATMAVLVTYTMSAAEWVWPQEMATQEGRLVIYQPQLEQFKGDKINARAAIAVHRTKGKEAVYGVFWFSGRLVTDRDSRTVAFEEVKIVATKFSSAASEDDRRLAQSLLNRMVPASRMSMSFDRFLAMTSSVEREKDEADRINTAPPKILFATTPTILVLINGKPILREIAGTGIQRVVNTPFVMLYEPSAKTYYLKGGASWYAASDISGAWQAAATPPASVSSAARQVAEPVDPAVARTMQTKPKVTPAVVVVTEPTELIVAGGEPEYSVIAGTDLLYMSNTSGDVFLDVKSKYYYTVLAGRWYRSPSLTEGAWAYVPSQKLPATFYQIPAASEKGHVLTFIADTKQADEAVMESRIPQTAAIRRSDAKADVTYDGTPKFETVKGTAIDYAVNTGSQVLRVRDKYYTCQQAVWYVSDSPAGPWTVSDSRPEEVDSIPPDSPVYNVKYAYVYDSTPDTVYVGYTPGYTGSYIYGGTVVYGTGYVYPGWYGTAYYPAPVTWGLSPWYYPYYGGWGFGAGFVSGTFFGFAAGAVASPWWGWGGWWGPWWGWGGWWGPVWGDRWHDGHRDSHGNRHWNDGRRPDDRRHSHNIYNRPGNASRNSQRPGTAGTTARLERTTAGARGDMRSQGARAGQPDRSRATGIRTPGTDHRSGSSGDVASAQRSAAGRQVRPDQADKRGSVRGNNVYASRDGSVYRRTDRGWEQRERGGWSRPQTGDMSGFYRNRPGLERDYSARSRGFERESAFRGSGSYRRGGTAYGGGISRGGMSRGSAPRSSGSRGR